MIFNLSNFFKAYAAFSNLLILELTFYNFTNILYLVQRNAYMNMSSCMYSYDKNFYQYTLYKNTFKFSKITVCQVFVVIINERYTYG